jgi:RNA polymerase sigma-70 factor (sigma-E family)
MGWMPKSRRTESVGRSGRDRAREEFDRFVAVSADDLLRTGYLVVWDLAEAEDLVQECLLKVARRWPRVRTMDQPLGYARRILINLALDGAKRRSRRELELDLEVGDEPNGRSDHESADQIAAFDARSELAAALGQLSARQRSVLVLRYFHDLSEAQVAEVLGCSLGTVKTTGSRGLARLRQIFEGPPVGAHASDQPPRQARSTEP